MAASNERLSANMMHFFVERGISQGTHKIYEACGGDTATGFNLIMTVMAAGPAAAREIIDRAKLKPQADMKTTEDWLRFFFPHEARPVYLFLDWRLTVTNYWWFWLGSWNPQRHDGIHPGYASFYGIKMNGNKISGRTSNGQAMKVDLQSGTIRFGNKEAYLKKVFLRYSGKVETKDYHRQKGLNFDAVLNSGFAALMDDRIAESVFNKLFLRHVFSPAYFEPLSLHTPYYQIWKVKGDKY
jgi:hypothetical protein